MKKLTLLLVIQLLLIFCIPALNCYAAETSIATILSEIDKYGYYKLESADYQGEKVFSNITKFSEKDYNTGYYKSTTMDINNKSYITDIIFWEIKINEPSLSGGTGFLTVEVLYIGKYEYNPTTKTIKKWLGGVYSDLYISDIDLKVILNSTDVITNVKNVAQYNGSNVSINWKAVFTKVPALNTLISWADMLNVSYEDVKSDTKEFGNFSTQYRNKTFVRSFNPSWSCNLDDKSDKAGFYFSVDGEENNVTRSYECIINFKINGSSGYPDFTTTMMDEVYNKYIQLYYNNKVTKGDLNGDGRINSTDYSLMRRYNLDGSSKAPTVCLENADLNGDGRINSTDYSYLRRYLLRIITEFPV